MVMFGGDLVIVSSIDGGVVVVGRGSGNGTMVGGSNYVNNNDNSGKRSDKRCWVVAIISMVMVLE